MKYWIVLKESNNLHFKELDLDTYSKYIKYIDPNLIITEEEFKHKNSFGTMVKYSGDNTVLCGEVNPETHSELEPRFYINYIETVEKDLIRTNVVENLDVNKYFIYMNIMLNHVLFGYRECVGCF